MKLNIDPKVKNILEWVYCFIIAIVIALLIKYFIGTPTVVKHVSMNNTLQEGQRLWLNRWCRTVHAEFKRGDIITFEAPTVTFPSLEDVDFDNPVARYGEGPKGLWAKFNYYVLEKTKVSYIKRIIGVSGDEIRITDGKVYLNGNILDEPYLASGTITESQLFTDIKVPERICICYGRQ